MNLLALLLLAPLPVVDAQAEGVRVAPTPAWADAGAALPSVDADAAGGVSWLLWEEQVDARGEVREAFRRMVWKVTSPQGVQDQSEVSVEFDPSFQEVLLHAVLLRRGDEVLDRLDLDEVEVVRREDELDSALVDGSRTALLFLEDVRVGDVIDVSYTLRGDNPAFEGVYGDVAVLGFGVPVECTRYRLLWPEGRALGVHPVGDAGEPRVATHEGFLEYEWVEHPREPAETDEWTPSWVDVNPLVYLTAYASWAEVARWAAGLYELGELSAEVKAQAAALVQGLDEPEARALAVLRFVQGEVRYLGLELGSGAFVPTPPADVLSRRYGDCKDKSLLLVALLREVGVTAEPFLVNTVEGRNVPAMGPSPRRFDHVIVRVHVDGQAFLIDPTDTYARGTLAAFFVPDYGFGLPVTPETTALARAPLNPASVSRRTVVAEYDAEQAGEPVRLRVDTLYEGAEADAVRAGLASLSRRQYGKSCRDYYTDVYPSISLEAQPDIEDDPLTNRLRVVEYYTLSHFWDESEGGGHVGWFWASELYDQVSGPDGYHRDQPLWIEYPSQLSYTMRIKIGAGSAFEEERRALETPGAGLDYRVRYADDLLEIEYEYETRADHVPADQAFEHLRRVGEMLELCSYGVTFG